MRHQIKNDLKRFIFSKNTVIVFAMCATINIWHIVQYYNREVYIPKLYYTPISVFDVWLGSSAIPIQSFAYFLLLPVIVLLVSGTSMFDDMISGYYYQLLFRMKKRDYFIARYISMFIYGGTSFVLPLVINFFIMALKYPINRPEIINGIGPEVSNVLGNIYYLKPGLYVIGIMIVQFVFAGAMSGISLLTTFYSSYRFEPVLVPFALYFGLYCICNVVDVGDFSPNYFLLVGGKNHDGLEFLISFVTLVAVFIVFMKKGSKYEI